MLLPTHRLPDAETLRLLTGHGSAGGDMVMLAPFTGTDADRFRAAFQRGLEVLFRNGLITAVPRDEWPEYVAF